MTNYQRFLTTHFIFIIFTLFLTNSALAQQRFPKPSGPINDFASVLSPDIRAKMDALSREILQKTGTTVVIVTLKSIGDNDPDIYANELYEQWGIGKKGEDKGLLIFLALKERKVRIETGYGVEGILPDGLVGSILDQYVVPYLRKGDYGNGLFNGMLALGQIIAKDAGVTIGEGYMPMKARSSRVKRRGVGLFPLLLFVFFILPLYSRRRGGMILPLMILMGMSGRGGAFGGGFGGGGFSGGFGGFGGGLSGGGGASRGF